MMFVEIVDSMPREHHQAKKQQLAAKPECCRKSPTLVKILGSSQALSHQKIKAELFFSWFQGSVSLFEILGLSFKGFNH